MIRIASFLIIPLLRRTLRTLPCEIYGRTCMISGRELMHLTTGPNIQRSYAAQPA